MNPLKLYRARSGDLTARWNDRQLHSRIDPPAEADRFLDSNPIAAHTFVVIGPGLGYLVSSIRRHNPYARILALAVHADLSRHLVGLPDELWTPESETDLSAFLSRHISDLATASVAVHEWSPVTDLFPSQAQEIRMAVSAHLHMSHASLVTQGATGRRWLRNRVFNFLHARRVRPASVERQIRAVALVAAGPSLEWALPRLAALRGEIEVWVTGSALDAVIARGIQPDVVVVTDASLYATEHIRAVLTAVRVPVAAPLSATRGVAGCERLLVLSESDSVDRALLGDEKSTPVIPPHGTVTATCALLIRALTSAPILLIGADFAWADERSHARPHLSEVYRQMHANRLGPASTWVYERSRSTEPAADGWTTSPSLLAYARWFETEATRRLAPIFALAPSPVLQAIPTLETDTISRLPSCHPGIGWANLTEDTGESRAATTRAYLERARQTVVRTPEPETSADLEADSPEFAELAVRLCLPELLRWDRSADGKRTAAWHEIVESATRELDSCLEILA